MRVLLNALRTFDQTPWAMLQASLSRPHPRILEGDDGVTVEGADLNTLENRR
ncbi:MAG TPA: hypothetical protein VMW85_04020 [Methanomassiliicoccales archaeon]|nr:hypothetical protein [Methanomassiliicoccales archaeon]